jgi:hypothetical protein
VFVYAEIWNGDKITVYQISMRYVEISEVPCKHHISLYSNTEMGIVENDVSAKIFPSFMNDVTRCVSFLVSTWLFVLKENPIVFEILSSACFELP